MTKCPIPDDELVRLHVHIMEHGVILNVASCKMMDIGGTFVCAELRDPWMKQRPSATLYTDNWEINFTVPNHYPHHKVTFVHKTFIEDVAFKGDEDIALRDISYAKMMT